MTMLFTNKLCDRTREQTFGTALVFSAITMCNNRNIPVMDTSSLNEKFDRFYDFVTYALIFSNDYFNESFNERF